MTVHTPAKRGPLHLRYDDGRIFVTPKDYDLFMVTARRAIEALKHACEVDNWAQRFFDDYAPRLHEWCKAHADQIGACYVTIKAPCLKVFVVAKTSYDQALGVEIAEFELALEDLGWASDIMQIPFGDEDELNTFFNPEDSVQIYAQAETAPGKG